MVDLDFSILDKTGTAAPERGRAYYKLEAEEKARASLQEAETQHREVYRAHQDAIRRAGILRADITKGIQAAESPHTLLLKAIECISLMTGDSLFHSQNKANMGAVYGMGLMEPEPLKKELQEVRWRLEMLTRPELDSEPADSRARIDQAIKAHRQREAQILKILR